MILQISTCLIAFTAILFTGCASSPGYTEPGIQPIEKTMIVNGYYWEQGKDPESFSDAEIRKLFERALSTEPFDGERSEIYSSQLVWALTSAGDEHFSELLRDCPKPIQTKVLGFIDGVWSYHKLSYPRTQALGRTTQAEQDAT
jgi:hypothetical protein